MAVETAQVEALQPAAQDVEALRCVFESIHAESCPTTFNFHMHTVHSDGQLQPDALIQQAIAIGLQGFAITDHHTTAGYQVAQQWLANWQQQHPYESAPHLWTGVEINADLLGTEVHILGYAFDPTQPVMTPYLLKHEAVEPNDYRAERVIAAIQTAGGLAVLAHPVRYRQSPELLIEAAAQIGINGVETYYAYDNPNPWRTSPQQTRRVQELSRSYNLFNTCGTDTHGRNLLQRL
jgi:predicted metal-dependent phosphoesterase TrpH